MLKDENCVLIVHLPKEKLVDIIPSTEFAKIKEK